MFNEFSFVKKDEGDKKRGKKWENFGSVIKCFLSLFAEKKEKFLLQTSFIPFFPSTAVSLLFLCFPNSAHLEKFFPPFPTIQENRYKTVCVCVSETTTSKLSLVRHPWMIPLSLLSLSFLWSSNFSFPSYPAFVSNHSIVFHALNGERTLPTNLYSFFFPFPR